MLDALLFWKKMRKQIEFTAKQKQWQMESV